MLKRIISVTTGTRADYGLLRPVLQKISLSKNLELKLIVTGMHLSKKYGLTINEIKKDGFKIHEKFEMIPKNNSKYNISKKLGFAIIEFSKIFEKTKPDINLVLGDRDEMLASSVAAYHLNIVNAHIHGGEKSGGIDEYTRHAITKISNIHFASTIQSKKRIIRMGENAKNVFFTGSPGIDEIKTISITNKPTLEKKYNLKFSGNEILFLFHPVTTQIGQTKNQIENLLQSLKILKQPIIAITPNSDSGSDFIFRTLEKFSKSEPSCRLFKSFPRSDYLGLLNNCKVLVGNSSSGIIEAGYFQIPVVDIGKRQNNRERSRNVYHTENFSVSSLSSIILKAQKTRKKDLSTSSIYGNGHASEKITKILETINLNGNLIEKQISF